VPYAIDFLNPAPDAEITVGWGTREFCVDRQRCSRDGGEDALNGEDPAEGKCAGLRSWAESLQLRNRSVKAEPAWVAERKRGKVSS